ncbi:aminotransferase [Ensifer sp. ENS07]|uniref:aminotransferase n=1 Tax=Ensifer sp. ENS07 TaxID=2769274 RepID=UPI00177B1D18|nr:aminotransferase [Ensifer sp. ENS07]MBD9638776.1 aminotransferase [Ensifer sp. ENS07]
MTLTEAALSRSQFTLSKNDTDLLLQADYQHLTHAWPVFRSKVNEDALLISGGAGARVFDASGRQYLDGMGGLWCVNMGYGRDEICDAVASQLRIMPYYSPADGLAHAPGVKLAEKIASLAPGDLNHVFFTCGGSTANDSALRFIEFYQSIRGKPQKRLVITRQRAYHGSTIMTASMGGNPAERSPHLRFVMDNFRQVSCPNPYRRPEGMSEEAFCDFLVDELRSKILDLGADNIAAFFAEPILGAGGVIVPPEGYNRRTWEVCREFDILYVADEVVTAFGRLGHFFASKEVFGTEPDMIVFAKGVTSGYQPLGGFIYSDAIHATLVAANYPYPLSNGYTYSAHPGACAAGLANIALMENEHICAHVRMEGAHFERRMKELADIGIVGEVRGSHFMIGIECVKDKDTKEPFDPSISVGDIVARHAGELGLIVRPLGSMIILSPPLVLSRGEIDEFARLLRLAILRCQEELVRDEKWGLASSDHVKS